MANKDENINTLSILLELDKDCKKDLQALKPASLELMVQRYIENARKTNHTMVDKLVARLAARGKEHVNTSLPVVGAWIHVKTTEGWKRCKRKDFISSSDELIEFHTPNGTSFKVPRGRVEWKAL